MLIDAGVWWLSANLILGLFNMIPWGPLDGAKGIDWSITAVYTVFCIFLIPVIGMFLGFQISICKPHYSFQYLVRWITSQTLILIASVLSVTVDFCSTPHYSTVNICL